MKKVATGDGKMPIPPGRPLIPYRVVEPTLNLTPEPVRMTQLVIAGLRYG